MADFEFLLTPGYFDVAGQKSSLQDLIETIRPTNGYAMLRHSVRVLNSLAFDRRNDLRDDQEVFVRWLPDKLQEAYRVFASKQSGRVRLFHPAQQLALCHAAIRYGDSCGGMMMGDRDGQERWATACLQVNDHLTKEAMPEGMASWERALYAFSEEASRWELVNPTRLMLSISRMRDMLTRLPALGEPYASAAARLKERFKERLGLDFATTFNLTAFMIFQWEGHSAELAENPDAALINRDTWLANSSISMAELDRYLDAVAMRPTEIPKAFDSLKVGMSFLETLPFRQRPLLRIDDKGIAFLCPQLVIEKGGVDLLWLLSDGISGGAEKGFWLDDIGILFEGYVDSVLSGLTFSQRGGVYSPRISWQTDGDTKGEIDGLIQSGRTLLVLETKASLLREKVMAVGSLEEVRDELERKFVQSAQGKPKGILQLVRGIHWLASERRAGKAVDGIDLQKIDNVIPVLIVSDRLLRFPGLGRWFEHRLRALLNEERLPWPVGWLVICGIEDLEWLEHLAVKDGASVARALEFYGRRVRRAGQPLWATYKAPKGPHPRLGPIMDEWIQELVDTGVMRK